MSSPAVFPKALDRGQNGDAQTLLRSGSDCILWVLRRGKSVNPSSTITQTEAPDATLRPLCVDLDGTLIKSDTLIDSLLVLPPSHPPHPSSLHKPCSPGRAVL